ncbi:MAG: hypothetical protein AB203_02730 [Parcubacteria bacterium C7867-008]|nr:MAG: hypothetical protein AB203_02730 [Parcubacteria bacterium C7867-008]
MKEHLDFKPVEECQDIVSESVYAVATGKGILAGAINPEYMNGHALSDHYDIDPDNGVNCIIVRGKRGEDRVTAAVLVPVGYRADLNGLVCEKLNAKKVSMAPLDDVIQESGMEYGSITPIGLPLSWKILIDSRLMEKETVIVGGGKQVSKLLVPMSVLAALPNTEIVENLSTRIPD